MILVDIPKQMFFPFTSASLTNPDGLWHYFITLKSLVYSSPHVGQVFSLEVVLSLQEVEREREQ